MYVGDCNSCGACCVTRKNGHYYRCQNLGVMDRIGSPDATFCAVHKTRTEGMPIIMCEVGGSDAFIAACLASYPRPEDAIPPECSYRWEPGELVQLQPAWSIGYIPGGHKWQ